MLNFFSGVAATWAFIGFMFLFTGTPIENMVKRCSVEGFFFYQGDKYLCTMHKETEGK